ncbi:MAG TPA: hypothetical protein VN859_07480 [Steroidobacteraceae bacterium]|nr:hypothetical protein [Steroidobacteraceae bacterium]
MQTANARGYLALGAIAALAALRLARLGLATLLLLKFCGPVVAIAGLLAAVLFGLDWLVRAGALAGAVLLWHWPVMLALLFAAPRLFTMLPGTIAMLLARFRHPRPLWQPLAAGPVSRRRGS